METLWSDFLNSQWHDWRGSGRSEDRLELRAWQERFLSDWHLAAPVPMPAEAASAMRHFRERLHLLAVKLADGGGMEDGDWQLLNEHLALDVVSRRLIGRPGAVRLVYVPVTEDWRHVRAEIAASFGETLLGERREGFACAITLIAAGFFMMIREIERKNTAMIKCAATS